MIVTQTPLRISIPGGKAIFEDPKAEALHGGVFRLAVSHLQMKLARVEGFSRWRVAGDRSLSRKVRHHSSTQTGARMG